MNSVGKSCLLHAYTTDSYDAVVQRGHVHKIEYESNITIEDKNVRMRLLDTAGSAEYDRLRPLAYLQSDLFLICFSVVNRESMANVKTKWCMELSQHSPGTPRMLVGTKIDLRDDPYTKELLKSKNTEPITVEEGKRMAEFVGAVNYVECSAMKKEGLDIVFLEAAKYALPPPPKKKASCSVS